MMTDFCGDVDTDSDESLSSPWNSVRNDETHGTSINSRVYTSTTGFLPRLNTENNFTDQKIVSYGAVSSNQLHSGQDLNSDPVTNVSINGDVVIQESKELSGRRPLILVTLMFVLVMCAVRINSIVMDQFLYQTFAKAIFVNVSMDTSSQPCVTSSGKSSNSSSETDLLHQVQKEVSLMSLTLDLTTYGIGMLSNMFLGLFSNMMSRKLLLLIPTTGFLLRCVEVSVVVYWELNIKWLYLGYVIDGICGNICGILLGTFLYTSDITPRTSKRTLGVAIIETAKGAVGAVFYIVSGQLIQQTGFIIPSLAAAGIQLLAVLVIFTLPDRRPIVPKKQREQDKSVKSAIVYMFSPLCALKDRRIKWMIRLATLAFLCTNIARQGLNKVENIYLMDVPFCFDVITIGWFLFARDLIQNLFAIFAVVFLFRCLSGMLLGITGALCMIAYCCMYAFAKYKWQILYIGALFANLAVAESVGLAAGTPLFLSVYNSTLDFFPGFVFLVGAGTMFLVVVIMCFFHSLWIHHARHIEYTSLAVPPPTQCEDTRNT